DGQGFIGDGVAGRRVGAGVYVADFEVGGYLGAGRNQAADHTVEGGADFVAVHVTQRLLLAHQVANLYAPVNDAGGRRAQRALLAFAGDNAGAAGVGQGRTVPDHAPQA